MTYLERELRWGEVCTCQFEAGVNHASGSSLWTCLPRQIHSLFYWPSWPANDLSKDQAQKKEMWKDNEGMTAHKTVDALHQSCRQTQRARQTSEHVKELSCPSATKSPLAITTSLKIQSAPKWLWYVTTLNVRLFVLHRCYARKGSYWRYKAVINSTRGWPSFVGAALLWSQCSREAEGIIATTLAEQLTAEKGSKSCGDDKRSACRKTIQSDSSKEAL